MDRKEFFWRRVELSFLPRGVQSVLPCTSIWNNYHVHFVRCNLGVVVCVHTPVCTVVVPSRFFSTSREVVHNLVVHSTQNTLTFTVDSQTVKYYLKCLEHLFIAEWNILVQMCWSEVSSCEHVAQGYCEPTHTHPGLT